MGILIPYTLSAVIVANLILSTIILSRGLRSRTNELFGFIAAGVALWSFAILGFYFFDTSFYWKRLWIILSHSSAIFISLLFFYFSLNFPSTLIKSKFKMFLLSAPFLAVLYCLFYTDTIIGGISGKTYEINFGYIPYALLMAAYFISGYVFLFLQYKKSGNLMQKRQIGYILLGSISASLLATITDLIFPFFGIFQYTWLGPVFTLMLVLSIAIAIFKYHLFNIKVIATELLTFLIWVFVLIRVFMSKTTQEIVINVSLLTFLIISGILLIRSVLKEVKTREELQVLTRELKAANLRLKKLDEAKSEFISIASHQLRTPLTAIKGYSSMLLEGAFGKLPGAAKIPLERILRSSKDLVSLVGEFLNLSRIERGKMEYKFERIDLKKLLKELSEEFKATNGKNLKITFEPDENEDFTVTADQNKIRQVISNLLDNAMKYTPEGFIRIYLYKDPEKSATVVKIKDSGMGMSKETLSRIFSKFTRAREGISQIDTEGLGMGLYIAKKISEDHGGGIRAESAGEGKGSVFYVELPEKFSPPRPEAERDEVDSPDKRIEKFIRQI